MLKKELKLSKFEFTLDYDDEWKDDLFKGACSSWSYQK